MHKLLHNLSHKLAQIAQTRCSHCVPYVIGTVCAVSACAVQTSRTHARARARRCGDFAAKPVPTVPESPWSARPVCQAPLPAPERFARASGPRNPLPVNSDEQVKPTLPPSMWVEDDRRRMRPLSAGPLGTCGLPWARSMMPTKSACV